MKSINYLFFSNYGNSFIYVILALTSSTVLGSPPCGLYGAPPCQFLPAPPGQTPSCARPGKTYCERISSYPTYLIKHLVHKWGYEAKNLLVDETWDEFASLSWHETSHFYDPAFIFPQQTFDGNSGNGAGGGGGGYGRGNGGGGGGSSIAAGGSRGGGGGGSSATNLNDDFNGYNYNTPTGVYGNENFLSKSTETPSFLVYNSAAERANAQNNHLSAYSSSAKVTPNNPALWLKRLVRELSERAESKFHAEAKKKSTPAVTLSRHTRDVSINMDLLDIVGVDRRAESTKRVKRQSAGRSSLCQTSTQYVTPQAALNSKGNWMFVVNEANTAQQMVKAELCASSTCTNLCQLPNGYNSRCEQKFVQKRLIALQANGQNLYTDTFWFPSCCVCTISSN